jgi:uncharacterized membrane protein
MGTCGLVGPLGTIAEGNLSSPFFWIGVILLYIALPAIITLAISELFRKLGLIKYGDLKLDL